MSLSIYYTCSWSMATILCNSVAAVMHTCHWATLLAIFAVRKVISRFLWLQWSILSCQSSAIIQNGHRSAEKVHYWCILSKCALKVNAWGFLNKNMYLSFITTCFLSLCFYSMYLCIYHIFLGWIEWTEAEVPYKINSSSVWTVPEVLKLILWICYKLFPSVIAKFY